MIRILTIVPLIVLAIAGVVFGVSLFRPEEAMRDPAVGRAFPTVELAPVGDHPVFNPADEVPQGPALVNVWASWCAPCIVEHPMLIDLAGEGIPIYGVDWKERQEGAGAAFLAQRGSPFAAVGADQGPAGVELGITGVPETFVIDANGKIVARYAGPLDVTTIAKVIRPALEQAASEAAEPSLAAEPS